MNVFCKNITLFASLLISASLWGQVNFSTKVSKKEVERNERFKVEFSLNQRGENFQAPSFSSFQVLSGPNTSVSTYMNNSGTRFSVKYSYILRAQNLGEATIGPAFIEVDGETIKTDPITVKVVKEKKQEKDPNSPEGRARENVFIRLLASRQKVYLGEPFFATYKLYFKTDIGQPQIMEQPDFTGFYQQKIEQKRIETQKETYEGTRYNTGELQQMVLIPQKSGKLNPGDLEMKVPTRVYTGQRDIFGRRVGKTVKLDIVEKFPAIEVKPLPAKNKPSSFSGAVGNFDFEVSLSQNELSTDESLNLKIKLKGSGNVKLADLPQPDFPKAFEAFDPEYSEDVDIGSYGMRGSKTAKYLLVPRYSGTYKIGPIEFSYFNPDRGEYQTVRTKQFEVKVTGGVQNPRGQTGVAKTEKEEVDFISKDILYIKTEMGDLQKQNAQFLGSAVFYILLIALWLGTIAIIIAFLLNRKARENLANRRMQKAGKVARKHLAQAQKELNAGHTEQFYQALAEALWGYFSDKLNIPYSQMSKEHIRQELNAKKVDDALTEQVIETMNRAEMARYATSATDRSAQDYEETADVLTQIEKQL